MLGGLAENVIEDLEAGPQMRAVRLHLKDVVLKNVNFNYVGKEFRKNSLTKTRFKFFHSGSSVIVAGKYDPVCLIFIVEWGGRGAAICFHSQVFKRPVL
jgi:6-phosphogluconate dehydrogenase (decarboxylating)